MNIQNIEYWGTEEPRGGKFHGLSSCCLYPRLPGSRNPETTQETTQVCVVFFFFLIFLFLPIEVKTPFPLLSIYHLYKDHWRSNLAQHKTLFKDNHCIPPKWHRKNLIAPFMSNPARAGRPVLRFSRETQQTVCIHAHVYIHTHICKEKDLF